MTASLDLSASRNVVWAPTIELNYEGGRLPVDGANVRLQVRLYPGAPGNPLASVANIPFLESAAPEGLSGRILSLYPQLPVTTLKAFPTGLNNPEAGEADRYAYDAVITYADGLQDKLALGSFILEPGVVNP